MFSMSLGFPEADALSQSADARVGLQALERSGIGSGVLNPIEVLVTGANPQALAIRMGRVDGIRGAIAPAEAGRRTANSGLVAVLPSADGTASSSQAALSQVRRMARESSASVQVGGLAAGNADFRSAVYDNFPLMVAILSIMTFVLLARAFRSLLLPLKAVGLVLVSVGAACGFMTFVWQDGHGSGLFWGVPATGSLTLWIP